MAKRSWPSNRRWRKLTTAQVRQIREAYAAGGISYATLGRQFGVSPSTIMQVVYGDVYKRVGGPRRKMR